MVLFGFHPSKLSQTQTQKKTKEFFMSSHCVLTYGIIITRPSNIKKSLTLLCHGLFRFHSWTLLPWHHQRPTTASPFKKTMFVFLMVSSHLGWFSYGLARFCRSYSAHTNDLPSLSTDSLEVTRVLQRARGYILGMFWSFGRNSLRGSPEFAQISDPTVAFPMSPVRIFAV